MLRKFLAVFAALLIALPPLTTPARADVASNIVQEGLFGRSLIGQTVYYYRGVFDYPAVVVQDVDTYQQTALVVFSPSDTQWVYARNLYSKAQKDIAQGAEGLGAAAVLCLFFCPGNKQGSGSSSSGSDTYRAREACIERCGNGGITAQDEYIRQQCVQRCNNDY